MTEKIKTIRMREWNHKNLEQFGKMKMVIWTLSPLRLFNIQLVVVSSCQWRSQRSDVGDPSYEGEKTFVR